MKPEVWLRTNRPLLLAALVPLLLLACAGGALIAWSAAVWQTWLGGVLLGLAGAGVVFFVWQWFTPRLAYADRHLLIYLRPSGPIRVPLEVVEAFLVGQDSTQLPKLGRTSNRTVTLIARLADRHKDWHRRDVHPMLGKWEDGYIIIRGTWCERICPGLVNRLNEKLAAAHQQAEVSV